MRALRKVGFGLAVLLLVLAVVMGVNTARFGGDAPDRAAESPAPPPIAPDALSRLAGAVRFQTISFEGGRYDPKPFEDFAAYLAASFPRSHATLTRETVAGHSLLYRWEGSDAAAKPILLAAHMDVVPVEAGTEGKWTHPPFAGTVADGYVWGRGAWDDKSAVMAILEAVEKRIVAGWQPERTVYLAFGHDEEVGGGGAQAIAALLKSRGVALDLVLDEGSMVISGVVPGVKPPVAMIGIAEKGFASVELIAGAEGGHSSMPPPPADSAIGRLAAAVGKLTADPFPPRMIAPLAGTLDRTGPAMDLPMRVVLANRWLTEPLVLRTMAGSPAGSASVRTTTAPTIFNAGTKANVLPQSARAVVNHRILPGDTVASVVARDRAVIDDSNVTVRPIAGGRDPSLVSATEGFAFEAVERATRRIFPDAVVAPGLVIAGTDARHYEPVSRAIYRFLPVRTDADELKRFHGTDERIAVADYARAIAFYEAMLDEGTRRAGPAAR
ncbi:M20 family peptidase [Sphingoaurantiacus capsulatus]|uniref:M20 family peptidase n=1 Tax=Sphingoaurantiacus capsulatus TaxID=1771310 RepID=A0ABV7X783_9SPHN